jgi:hypothetical protein
MPRRIPRLMALLPCFALACNGSVVDPDRPGSSKPGEGPAGPMGTRPMGGNPSRPGAPGVPGAPIVPGSVNPGLPGVPAVPGGAPVSGTEPPTAIPMPPTALPTASPCTNNVPGPRLLRRLSTLELDNTLQDLFGDPAVPRSTALADPEVLGFKVDAAQLVVRDLGAQQIGDFAEEVARWAVTSKLATLSSCSTTDAACRQSFIKGFGRRAFRAPLTDAQLRAYEGLFAAEPTFSQGVSTVITAMLQSVNFLYRRELGKPEPSGGFVLLPQEIASNLSYLLTQGPPDEALAQAAETGALSTRAQIDAQADRLMKTPRAKKALGSFVRGWLGLDRLEGVAKDDRIFALTDELRKDMLGETETLFTSTFESNGSLADLLTSPHTFVNANLARFYGVRSGAGGPGFLRFTFAPGERDPGLLAHAGLMATLAGANSSSPVKRGKLVRTRLLCNALPDPPQDVDTNLKPPVPGQSTRERFSEHSSNPACSACHLLMDPIGFGFERYDAFGRTRATDNGVPVDTSGQLITGAGSTSFNGVSELATVLAESEEAKACLVRYWAYFAYGVSSWPQDSCTLETVMSEASQNQFSLRSVLMAIIHSPHFTRRVGR